MHKHEMLWHLMLFHNAIVMLKLSMLTLYENDFKCISEANNWLNTSYALKKQVVKYIHPHGTICNKINMKQE